MGNFRIQRDIDGGNMIKYLIAFIFFAQVSFAGGVMFLGSGVESGGATCTTSTHTILSAFSSTTTSTTAIAGTEWKYQTFTSPSGAWEYTGANVFLTDTNTDTGNCVAGGVPTTEVSGSQVTIAASSISDTGANTDFFLGSAISGLSTSTVYAIVLRATSSGTFDIDRNAVASVAGYSLNSGSTWTEQSYQIRGEGVYGCE